MGHREMEAHWRSRLADAKLRLDFTRNFLQEVQRDFPLGDPSPDGQFAYQKALRAERHAQEEYTRVLRLYTQLVLDGKIPDAHEWRNADAGGA